MATRTTVVFADRRDRATRMTPSQHAKRTVGTLHTLRLHYTHSNGDVHFETCCQQIGVIFDRPHFASVAK